MGFGLLFIGYLLTFVVSMTLYGWAIRIVGCVVMMIGMHKLREYFRQFVYAEVVAALFLLTGIAEGVFYFIKHYAGEEALPQFSVTLEGWVWLALVMLLHLLMLWALSNAAADVGLDKQRTTALTAMIITVLWASTYALGTAKIIPPGFYYLMLIILIVVTAISIFGCYKNICPEGAEDMGRKKTGIQFLDRFFEKLDARETRAVETTRREIEERERKRADSRNSKRRKK